MADEPNGSVWSSRYPIGSSPFTNPTLSEIAEVLQRGMRRKFLEVKVDVASCPCLTREPFNSAGIGLNSNTYMVNIGSHLAFIPTPRPDISTWDMRQFLSSSCADSFIIGASYASKPYMPYNGHLIMNATYRAPADFTNASRIIFTDPSNGQRKIETLIRPDQMMCSFSGNFFVSEGRQGNVIRIRAKSRNSNYNIISVMENILFENFFMRYYRFIGLGGVLKMRNGRVARHLMPEVYPEQVLSVDDLIRSYQCHNISLKSDLIAVGTLVSLPPFFFDSEMHNGFPVEEKHCQFNSFSIDGAGEQFCADTTFITEYEGYFNVADNLITI